MSSSYTIFKYLMSCLSSWTWVRKLMTSRMCRKCQRNIIICLDKWSQGIRASFLMACRSTCAQCQSRSALSRSAAARICLRCLKECCVIQRVDGRFQYWPVLFFQKPVDCRRHQVHLGRVDCHKPAPAQKDVYTYYLSLSLSAVNVGASLYFMSRNSV